jgi:plasmid rolling circle replication initiator protein Rep
MNLHCLKTPQNSFLKCYQHPIISAQWTDPFVDNMDSLSTYHICSLATYGIKEIRSEAKGLVSKTQEYKTYSR